MESTSERSQKGQYTSKRGKVLENDMIAKCESVQGQRTQLSEFLLQNDRHNREQTWQFPTWSTRSICPLERNPFQDEESGRFGFTKLDVVVGL